jgi:tubulin-specific chaperone B
MNSDPHAPKGQFSDLSQVEKYELPDEEYAKRTDSVLSFKQRNKFGRFSDSQSATSSADDSYEEEAKKIKIGDRCQVDLSESGEEGFKRIGTVKYVGLAKFRPGFWIGVEYDEPVGRHDGM